MDQTKSQKPIWMKVWALEEYNSNSQFSSTNSEDLLKPQVKDIGGYS